ncbi:putative diphthamide biosynthesis protein Dph2 [Aulographum hederae CBS 113979]|uniref:2-(3-amino-3-carboxypropyl)histidine synthase subunit 2 n=1 Tax=Aulographum hederae CBS 113979 TaxID=1176131 RepID=A0A6G1GVG7_9PEZI|nr:putative diphthamide biosynthesis protein Dph2 [Aulographum hederae CBS 113979]
MASPPSHAPVLSTPAERTFEDPTPVVPSSGLPHLSDEQLYITYEIQRTVQEIREGRWKRITLQFPDAMLGDGVRVYEALARGLREKRGKRGGVGRVKEEEESAAQEGSGDAGVASVVEGMEKVDLGNNATDKESGEEEEKLFILADTSYGACCVDEVAAEHVDADAVVHYGRSCLSPTARLPVVYVFTTRPLDLDSVVKTFAGTYPDKSEKVVLMADLPYHNHLEEIHSRLKTQGYGIIWRTEVVHDPSSPLPNRTVPREIAEDVSRLRDYRLFHISDPPASFLLTLSSRVGAINIFPTAQESEVAPKALLASSSQTLRRRYALCTRLSTVPIFGILINTLSVKNYLHIVSHVQEQIAAAGKKSYTFVVGKINAAKVANFSEIGGWVVIGCWESSLVESSEFWKPVITPFELTLALRADDDRIWTGEWSADFEAILKEKGEADDGVNANGNGTPMNDEENDGELDSEEESAPPEFDLRTGRYVSHSRPMRTNIRTNAKKVKDTPNGNAALIKRANGDLAQVGGVVSPGAEFLRSNRTWQGLGSDFEIAYEEDGASAGANGAAMEQGRSGIARGYVVGDHVDRS